MENALKANPQDVGEQYERQLKRLQEAYGEAMLELRARKKLQSLLDDDGPGDRLPQPRTAVAGTGRAAGNRRRPSRHWVRRWWDGPTAGDIVWCHFPDDVHPRPKSRPALVMSAFDDDEPHFTVRVGYGTSQHTTTLHRGEFSILRERHPAAYAAAGLSHDKRFDLKQALDLPYCTDFRCRQPPPTGRRRSLGCCPPLWYALFWQRTRRRTNVGRRRSPVEAVRQG